MIFLLNNHHLSVKRFLEWSNSWRNFNDDFEYRLWTDDDNRQLILEHYPWFLKTYDEFPKKIMRIDSTRVFYLHKYGGLYTDLDIECLKPIQGLLGSHDLILARMGDDDSFEHSLPNAWMASKPGHPFWLWCAKRMMDSSESWWAQDAEHTTGPAMIYYAYHDYIKHSKDKSNGNDIYIAPKAYIFSYDWSTGFGKELCNYNRDTFSVSKCVELIDPKGEAYAMSYWAHSWEENKPEITFSFNLFGWRIMI